MGNFETLSEFPLMFTTSLLCKLRYGWSFGEASAINEVSGVPVSDAILTGTEPVILAKAFVGHTPITFSGERSVTLMPGEEVESDAVSYAVHRGDTIEVSFYLEGFTQMNSGTFVSGPLSKSYYAYGDYAEADELPLDLSRNTNWFYFLNTIDVLTSAENHAIVCYGDSITAQSWPDYMAQQAFGSNCSIIRRAVSGTRILRQYDCITYQAYGLKGATRFPIEMNVAGATDVIIQHGINDIIHLRRMYRLRCSSKEHHQSQGFC